MPAPDFLDSNVLVYAYDSSEPVKRAIAQKLVLQALNGEMVISAQVLAEFAVTLLNKISPAARPEDVQNILDVLTPIKFVAPDVDLIRRAVDARKEYGVHLYDGMILAAAERAGCGSIWSEDLNAGQLYFGIKIVNPFTDRH
jgi:predicted nucleic acid-binding protein